MSKWFVLFRKEMLDMQRSFKWIWIPLVFILLGIMNPITSYYMPEILNKAGSLPEGAIIQIPVPTAAEVLAKTLSQYDTLGVLILVLSFMGIIAGERQSGAAVLILVKPVSHASYLTAKWAAAVALTFVSTAVGYISAWYYTGVLIGHVAFSLLIQSLLVYFLWLLFVVTVTVLFGALLKHSGAIAFLTMAIVMLIAVATSLLPKYMQWSPGRLTAHAGLLAQSAAPGPHFWLSAGVTAAIIAALLIVSVASFKRKQALQ